MMNRSLLSPSRYYVCRSCFLRGMTSYLFSIPPAVFLRTVSYLETIQLFRLLATCKTLQKSIDSNPKIWVARLKDAGLWLGGGSEESFERALSARNQRLAGGSDSNSRSHPYKTLFISRSLTNSRWMTNPSPNHLTISTYSSSVITCLILSSGRIIVASDDHSIRVYSLSTGELIYKLLGHSGGIWDLSVAKDILVSGSTDQTLRIWDLKSGKCRYTFAGHTGTIRAVSLVKPEVLPVLQVNGSVVQERWPTEPLIVTGSRDHTLRVWELPGNDDKEYHDEEHTDAEDAPGKVNQIYFKNKSPTEQMSSISRILIINTSYPGTIIIFGVSSHEAELPFLQAMILPSAYGISSLVK
jgi:F-box and WD-40 domain protein CDC4